MSRAVRSLSLAACIGASYLLCVDPVGGSISFVDQVDCASMARGGRLIFARAFRDDDSNSILVSGLIRSAGKLPDSSVVFIYGMIWVSAMIMLAENRVAVDQPSFGWLPAWR